MAGVKGGLMSESDPGEITSIGARLRTQREAKKLTLDDVASKTRIPIRHLQHIENEEWDALPAPTYTIGFARAYANAVGLNGNEIGVELREQIGRPRTTTDTPPSYYEAADPARVPPKSLAMVAAGIALLLILGYLIWRNFAVNGTDEPVPADAQAPVEQSAPAAAAQPAVPSSGTVVVAATDEVWLRIYEANGQALFQGIMKPGDRFEVPATAQRPQIRTGRPQALRISVGGTDIPPLGAPESTIDNVSLLPADLAARTATGGTAGVTPPSQQQ
jgi:cytoskeletal protein RodZ